MYNSSALCRAARAKATNRATTKITVVVVVVLACAMSPAFAAKCSTEFGKNQIKWTYLYQKLWINIITLRFSVKKIC